MLVFEDEVTELLRHDNYYVKQATGKTLPVEVLMQRVSATLPDSVEATGVTMHADPEKAWQVSLFKPRRASVYVDQYTGEVIGKSERMPFFSTMFRLHRWLLGTRNSNSDGIGWGKMIVGTSTLIFVFVLISGIIIWWPRTKRALANSLKISVNKGQRRLWHDLHVAGGMYALILLLVMALTGLTWSFGWYRTGFYKLFGAEVQQGGHGGDEGRPARPQGGKMSGERPEPKEGKPMYPGASTFAKWESVYNQLKSENPDYLEISVSEGKATVRLDNFGNQRAADNYMFDNSTGVIGKKTLYADGDISRKLRGWIFSVHVGSWGGLFTRILWFLASLLGATLPLTGYYLWIKRLKAKKKH